MKRVIAVVACGFTLTACTSSWMPTFELPSMPSMPSFSGGGSSTAASLAVESDPPGAQASTAGGASCVTPCRLNVKANGPFTVNIALNGYVPQSVPVRVMQPEDPHLGSEEAGAGALRLDPNPVYVELERAAPPPPPPKKKPVPKHTPTAARHTAPTAATQAPASPTNAAAPNTAPAPAPQQQQQPNNGTAPWPMPR